MSITALLWAIYMFGEIPKQQRPSTRPGREGGTMSMWDRKYREARLVIYAFWCLLAFLLSFVKP